MSHFLKSFVFTMLGGMLTATSWAQDCIGGQFYSNEAYLYGRFEVAMRSVGTDGVVSSFFLYNLDVGCNWPDENNEIDIEMTGNLEQLYFTTHYPGPVYYTDIVVPDFNPHAEIHEYAIEWEPGIVRWFADGELVNVQDDPFVDGLIQPMRIMMNLYATDIDPWVGTWDPSSMPLNSEYEYVRCFEYTPGSGDSGTDNNFALLWEDEFEAYNEDLWTIEDHAGFDGNYCTFKPEGVSFGDGRLYLHIIEEDADPDEIMVQFQVIPGDLPMEENDVLYLNGSFNNWCGTCNPMTDMGDHWELTIPLVPDAYEYVFTLNNWEEIGNPPPGSACDFYPCDEWYNYGFVLNTDDPLLVLDAYCWDECEPCWPTSIGNKQNNASFVIATYDLLGRPVKPVPGQLHLVRYSDGTVRTEIIWK